MTELDTENIYLVMQKPYTNFYFNDEDFDPFWYFTSKEEAQDRIDDPKFIDEQFKDKYYIITLAQFLESVENLKQRYDDMDDEKEDYE